MPRPYPPSRNQVAKRVDISGAGRGQSKGPPPLIVEYQMVKGKRANPVTRFLRETRSELRKVVWPSRQEATNLTIIVIAVTLTMAASLGFIDYVFSKLLGLLIR